MPKRPALHQPDTSAGDLPMTPPPPTVDVYARWAGYAGGKPCSPEDFSLSTHSYVVKAPPAEPLTLGSRARIIALSPVQYHQPDADGALYDVYDPHVAGTITRIMGWRGTVLALELENDCKINPVRSIRLEVPYIPNVSVRPVVASKSGRGPRVADAAESFDCRVTGQLATEGRCGGLGCAMRATALAGDGILDAFWLPGHRDPPPRRVPQKGRKRARGNMEAAGWEDAD